MPSLNALPALTWRMLPSVNVAAPNGVADVLHAVKLALDSTTYADGSGRTPGSGQAWSTANVEGTGATTEGMELVPPTDSPISTFRGVIGGSSAAKTPAMLSPDTWQTNTVMVGYGKVGGTFVLWDDATPYGAAHFSGHSRGSQATSTSTYTSVRLYECAEGLVVSLLTASAVAAFALGALFEGLTTEALDAETNGRVYGLLTSGSGSNISTAFHSSDVVWADHDGSNANPHVWFTIPGSTTQRGARRLFKTQTSVSTTSLRSKASGAVTLRHYYRDTSTDQYIGRLREIEIAWDMIHAQTVSEGASVKGYVLGSNPAGTGDCLLLKY